MTIWNKYKYGNKGDIHKSNKRSCNNSYQSKSKTNNNHTCVICGKELTGHNKSLCQSCREFLSRQKES